MNCNVNDLNYRELQVKEQERQKSFMSQLGVDFSHGNNTVICLLDKIFFLF